MDEIMGEYGDRAVDIGMRFGAGGNGTSPEVRVDLIPILHGIVRNGPERFERPF